MKFDIRVPVGSLFTALGIILTIVGMTSDKALYERSLGININLRWGLVLTAFGLFMLVLSSRQRISGPASEKIISNRD